MSTRFPLLSLAALAGLFPAGAQASPLELGNPWQPPGAGYQIEALQGITASNPLGSTANAQVNQNVEFLPGVGVTYENSRGRSVDFGIGLYRGMCGQTFSTGLDLQYSTPVTASNETLTLGDFDLTSNPTGFNPTKVEPSILIQTTNGNFEATPAQVFPLLAPNTTLSTSPNTDIWNVNLGALLSSEGQLANSQVTGVILSADDAAGEKVSGDPYFFVAASNGTSAVPEPSSLLLVAGTLALGVFLLPRRRPSSG